MSSILQQGLQILINAIEVVQSAPKAKVGLRYLLAQVPSIWHLTLWRVGEASFLSENKFLQKHEDVVADHVPHAKHIVIVCYIGNIYGIFAS